MNSPQSKYDAVCSIWSSFYLSEKFYIFAFATNYSILIRKILISFATLICSYFAFAQSNDTTVLIIPCKSGELIIDGVSKGKLIADDAHREQLSFGDHYIQLKKTKKKLIALSRLITQTQATSLSLVVK